MKITWKTLALSGLLVLSMTNVRAEFVGLKLGVSNWEPSLTGSFNSGVEGTIDLIGDLGLDDPSQSSVQFILEHPIPLLPNIKYQRFELDSTGINTPGAALDFGGVNFPGSVTSTFDLSHDDIVLYYEVLDNWVNLDIGLDLKRFDGEVALVDTLTPAINSSILVDLTIPLLYLSARFDLPFSGFYIGADINNFSFDDNTVEDSTLMLGYESESGIGIEGGIKKFSLELGDANNLNTNLEYDGVYLNGYIHF